MEAKIDDQKKPKIGRKDAEALDILFATGSLADEHNIEPIRKATEELVALAKRKNISFDKLAASSRDILGWLIFVKAASKYEIVNHVQRVWGRTHDK